MAKLIPGVGEKPTRKQKRRRLITVSIVVIVVIVVGIATLLIIQHLTKPKATTASTSDASAQTLDQRANIAAGTNYADGQQVYQQAASSITGNSNSDKEQLAQIYLSQADLASAQGPDHYDEALNYALKAESTYPSRQSASSIAGQYFIKDDTANALKYYKLQLARTSDDWKNSNPTDYAGLQKTIADLEGAQ